MNFRAIPALDAYDMLQPKNSDQWILGWKRHWTGYRIRHGADLNGRARLGVLDTHLAV